MKLEHYLICRIIITFVFLVSSTYIWFNRKVEIYHDVDKKIVSNEVEFVNIEKVNNTSYNLKVENLNETNETFRIYIVPSLLNSNVSNNYIKYQINDGSIRTLNMDGMIFSDVIMKKEIKDFSLKLWISDTYKGDLNFSGKVVVI